ncbi:hypothetical protein PM082_018280 [Marasmius tenuissimus]|nr:hypothetical protein PM082_018280 [Marasmius tenuissimus]
MDQHGISINSLYSRIRAVLFLGHTSGTDYAEEAIITGTVNRFYGSTKPEQDSSACSNGLAGTITSHCAKMTISLSAEGTYKF